MPSTSQTHGFPQILTLMFMVITPRTLVTCRPYCENPTPKMELMLMHRLIVACQAQKGT